MKDVGCPKDKDGIILYCYVFYWQFGLILIALVLNIKGSKLAERKGPKSEWRREGLGRSFFPK